MSMLVRHRTEMNMIRLIRASTERGKIAEPRELLECEPVSLMIVKMRPGRFRHVEHEDDCG